MRTVFILLVLVVGSSALSFDVQDAKERPVSKVVNLLKDMQVQLEKEGDEDAEVYEKLVCWCETNDAEKTKAIADAEQHLTDLTASIEELTATSARLTTEISNLKKEVAANGQALDTATSLRAKELAEFVAEEKDSLASISGIRSAITAISKHNAAMLQSDVMQNIAAMIGSKSHKYADILEGTITPSQKKTLTAFVQTPKKFLATPAFKQSYAPQSGEIFGIMNNMKESFEANLATAQADEAESVTNFNELKAAKEAEIASGTEQIEAKTQEMAEADESNGRDQQDREDTAKTLAADQEYLAMLKETCSDMDSQMEQRQKTRAMEVEAVSKAIAILAGDEAKDTFSRTLGFVQKASTKDESRRERAAKVLLAASKKLSSPKLATLATSVRLDAFGNLQKALNRMIADLEGEKKSEIDHRDWCIEEFSNNDKTTELTNKDKDFLNARIEKLTANIDQLTEMIDNLRTEIADMQTQIKHAGQDREMENNEYKATVTDQRATQKLLTEAVNVLKGFYDKAVLVQVGKKQPAGPPPPAGFKSYDKEKGSGPIVMIEEIIAEAKELEAEAIRGEEEAQKAYEDMVRETNAAIDAANVDVTNKRADKGKAEGDKAEMEVELEAKMSELEILSNTSNDLHSSCDFLLKNFDLRQSKRDDEVEALKSAKLILTGAKTAFLQKF